MMIVKQEDEKRKDIVSHVEKSIFVEAGAGAGKTTLIVQRITNQIRHGFLKPEELVVITFTNKAAGELFERIQKSFESEEKNSADEEEKARFTYAIEHLEQMHISTIHSFCFSLLKEHCFEAKLPLGVKLLENEETTQRKSAFFENWFAGLSKADIEKIKNAISLFSGQNYYYKEKVAQIFMKICEKPEDVNFVSRTDAELVQLEQDTLKYVQVEEQLRSQINAEILAIGKKGQEIFEKHVGIPFHAEVEGLKLKSFYKYLGAEFPRSGGKKDTYNSWVAKIYAGGVELCNKGKGAVAKKYAAANEEFSSWLNAVIGSNNLYAKWEAAETKSKEYKNSYAYYTLLKYAISARDAYLSQLERDHLSNDQLIQKAKELIWNSQEARAFFGSKYKCIYVDEFQDTDHIQADLMWKLACDETGVLKPGALFVVGDPKQAIYRFRGGEPAVYNQIKKKMVDDAQAEVYELDNNYRSNEEVIRWVNEQFKDPINDSGINYRDMACVSKNIPETPAKPGEENLILRGVYHMPTLAGYDKNIHGEKAGYEAAILTFFIQTLVSKKYQIYETRKTDSGYQRSMRQVQYGDFLILCKDTFEMDDYMEAMKAASIPVDLAGKTDINTNAELRRFLALYRFLVQPYDEKSKQGARQIVSQEARLKLLRAETKGMNLYGKAEYLLEHMEYLFSWDKEIAKEEIYAIQARLHQMVENVFALAKEEPEHVLQAFEAYLSNVLERELMLDEKQSAVRFMNVHKAKGLEGVITIVTNRKSKGRKEHIPDYTSASPNANGKYDFYTHYSDNFTKIHGYDYNADAKAAYEKAKAEEDAEAIRLEYVAATRAKEVLIVTESYGDGSFLSGYSIPVANNIARVLLSDELEESEEVATEQEEKPQVETAGKTILSMPTADMKQASYISISPSNLEIRIKKESSDSENQETEEQNEIDAQAGKVLTEDEIKKLSRRPKGNVFGTTMHRSYELLIHKEGDITTCVCQAIIENAEDLLFEGKKRYLKEGEPEEIYLTAVKAYLETALERFSKDTAMVELLANAKEVYTEFPFSYYTSSEESPELFAAIGAYLDRYLEKEKIEKQDGQMYWINGTADLVVVKADGSIHIIDFKSDTKYVDDMEAFEKSIYEKYEGQLLLYKYSISRIFGVDVDKISTELYHLYQ